MLLAIVGTGLGLFIPPNNAAIMGSVPQEQSGLASGVLNMTRGMGTALGLALTGLVFDLSGGRLLALHRLRMPSPSPRCSSLRWPSLPESSLECGKAGPWPIHRIPHGSDADRRANEECAEIPDRPWRSRLWDRGTGIVSVVTGSWAWSVTTEALILWWLGLAIVVPRRTRRMGTIRSDDPQPNGRSWGCHSNHPIPAEQWSKPSSVVTQIALVVATLGGL